jgi:DNA polymerase I
MEDSLFSEADLDQELIALTMEKKIAKVPEVKAEKKDFDKKLFIVDGYSLIYRSYYAFIARPLSDREGKNVSAYYGFFNTLFSLIRNYKFDYFVVALDSHGPTFRREMYSEYKANRAAAPEDLHEQVPRIADTLKKMNIPYIAREGFEADDLIATLAKNAERLEVDTVMVTGDKDLLQLVGDHVFALRPSKNDKERYELYGRDEVYSSFGVKPEQIVDYLSLLGDASDNVPGVKGIGEKGAVKLLSEYVSLDGIYRHLDSLSAGVRKKLEDGKEMAYFSKKLIMLKDDVFNLETFDCHEYRMDTVDYGAGVADFELASCKSLARTAFSFANGNVKPAEKADKPPVVENAVIEVPEELRGLGAYETITDLKVLDSLLHTALDKNLPVAFDTETTSLDPFEAKLVGFSISYESKKAYYVPLISENRTVVEESEALKVLSGYFTGKLKIVGQNLKYDCRVLLHRGLALSNLYFDTMVAAWMADSDAGIYNMDDLALRYLNYETIKFEDVVPKGESFSVLSADVQTRYAAEDADITLRLYLLLSAKLEEMGKRNLFDKMEMPLLPVLISMEENGIRLDEKRLSEIGKTVSAECGKLSEKVFALAGETFNLNSTQQLSHILFEKRGLTPGKKTRSGYSTDTATLEELVSSGDEIIPAILSYRTYAKLKSTYVDSLSGLEGPDGRIHTQFLQTGTATGRLSSKNPNLQNIPIRTEEGRLIRTAFVPKEGSVFLSADYSQVELVVLAHLSGDPALRSAFIKGSDVHRNTASLIFSKEESEVTPEERRAAKTINFGIMYGMSAFRLAGSLGISRSDAQSFIDRYFERYTGIKAFVERTVRSAEENGYVETMFSHRRRVMGIKSQNKVEKAAAERVAVNTVIQGSAAEIMKKAMIEIDAELRKRQLGTRILLQVHDELIFEVPLAEKEEAYSLVKEKMEGAATLSVPLRAGLEFGNTWGEMH